jgi:hypothetical protein
MVLITIFNAILECLLELIIGDSDTLEQVNPSRSTFGKIVKKESNLAPILTSTSSIFFEYRKDLQFFLLSLKQATPAVSCSFSKSINFSKEKLQLKQTPQSDLFMLAREPLEDTSLSQVLLVSAFLERSITGDNKSSFEKIFINIFNPSNGEEYYQSFRLEILFPDGPFTSKEIENAYEMKTNSHLHLKNLGNLPMEGRKSGGRQRKKSWFGRKIEPEPIKNFEDMLCRFQIQCVSVLKENCSLNKKEDGSYVLHSNVVPSSESGGQNFLVKQVPYHCKLLLINYLLIK